MDAVEYLKQKNRMTNNCTIACNTCPLAIENNNRNLVCANFVRHYIEEAVEIVENWAKEHPAKTYKDVFLEKFPDAKIEKNGVPYPCIIYLFGEKVRPRVCGNCSCTYCWDREIEE